MSGSRLLLDTNAVSTLFKGEEAIRLLLEDAEEVFLSIVVLGELYYGARKSGRVEKNLEKIATFADTCTLLDCDREVAHFYGLVRDRLRRLGLPIPENDIWIASTSLCHGLDLVTHDHHFDHVEGLSVLRWDS